jgi:protein tyrosine phosphatase (PTP) superfamily phosphohydrolase (DUF442 family)
LKDLESIRDYVRIHDALSTSGLPEKGDFAVMGENGYEFVISICTLRDEEILENEDRLVEEAGMKYIHFPVDRERPSMRDYELLRDQLNMLMDRKVWLHCTRNRRVSALIYLYNVLERGMDSSAARFRLETIWKPGEEWERMIAQTLEKYVYQYL